MMVLVNNMNIADLILELLSNSLKTVSHRSKVKTIVLYFIPIPVHIDS